MPVLFSNRREAGRLLGARVALRGYDNPLVLGLPRGGVPVALEVARAIHAPLDVFVVRKLGVPGHEELAMGAIASHGVRVLVPEIVTELGIPDETIDLVSDVEQRELERRERAYRGARPPYALEGVTAIVVDDGAATGASMIAAIRALRMLRPAKIVAAAPVMSDRARAALHREADACEAVVVPDPFYGVGSWYDDFTQTTDDEVRSLLAEAAERRVAEAVR